VKPGTHPQDGESEPGGEDKPGTHPEDGESEPGGKDKPGTHPQDGESEPGGKDKPGTHPQDGESEPGGEDKPGTHPQDGESQRGAEEKGHLWLETRQDQFSLSLTATNLISKISADSFCFNLTLDDISPMLCKTISTIRPSRALPSVCFFSISSTSFLPMPFL